MKSSLLRIGALGLLLSGSCFAQPVPIRFSGGITLSSDFSSGGGVAGQYRSGSSRAILRPTITLFDQVVLPFELYMTTEGSGYRQPFNQFGVNPRLFGWLTLHAGYFSARISDLTFGDTRLLGGGVEARPGSFRLAFLYGRSRRAVAPDTLYGIRGEYEQRVLAAKMGYGKDEKAFVELNLFHAADQPGSLSGAPPDVRPQENAVVSLAFGLPLFTPALHLTAEAGVAAFSNDVRSEEARVGPPALRSLFTPRYSSQVDGAAKATLRATFSSAISLTLAARWIGPGYRTMGYSFMQNDLLETTIAPVFRLFNGKLSLRGSLGLRQNNLRQNRVATTRRTVGSASAAAQITPSLSCDLQYQNYGIRSLPPNDTLRIDNVLQSIMLSPRYTFQAFGAQNSVALSLSLQDYTDYNTFSGALSSNRVHVVTGSWLLGIAGGTSFATTMSLQESKAAAQRLQYITLGETISRRFMLNKLSVSLTGVYTIARTLSVDRRVIGRCTISYTLAPWGTFTAQALFNRVTAGTGLSGRAASETRASLQYSIGF